MVPVGVVLGEGEALALDRMTDDSGRPVGVERHAAQHPAQRRDVMAVDLGDRKAEGAPLVGERLEVEDLCGRAGRLHLVVVDHRRSGC